jgi:hypothetical protein
MTQPTDDMRKLRGEIWSASLKYLDSVALSIPETSEHYFARRDSTASELASEIMHLLATAQADLLERVEKEVIEPGIFIDAKLSSGENVSNLRAEQRKRLDELKTTLKTSKGQNE